MKKRAEKIFIKFLERRIIFSSLFFMLIIFIIINVLDYLRNPVMPFFFIVQRGYFYITIVLPLFLFFTGGTLFCGYKFFKLHKKLFYVSAALISLSVSILGIRIYSNSIEPYRLQIKEEKLYSEKINSPLRIVHVTDIQIDKMTEYEINVFKKIKECNPDLILFTGDLIQTRIDRADYDNQLQKMKEYFSELHPRYGMFGVYGDVDPFLDTDHITDIGGLRMLQSENNLLSTPAGKLNLITLSLKNSRFDSKSTVKELLKKNDPAGLTIVMGHSPDFIPKSRKTKADLYLAGHTHGGQICIPFYGAPITYSNIPRRLASGFQKYRDIYVNVSGGIGCEHAFGLPMLRFNCPPEFSVIDLLPEKDSK